MIFEVRFILLLSFAFGPVSGWDSEELEIFDLVEEINTNFYKFMGIKQEATIQEIKRAFRNMSIMLHPDKSSAEDANIQFRNLVSIYEVLKDASKREKYNNVLREGLPNWKSALYYYRRMRKIGLYEGGMIIFIIVTIGQYLFAWAAYIEKKFTAEHLFGTKLKKLQKRNKNISMDAIINEIPTPSILRTLPFQIPLAIWHLPRNVKTALNKATELKELTMEKRKLKKQMMQQQEDAEKELEEQLRLRKEKKESLRRRRLGVKPPEKTDDDLRGYSTIGERFLDERDTIKAATQKHTTLSGGFWTDEDLSELIRLLKKYPSGTNNRWETIAEVMNRTVQELTFMAAKMKENGYRIHVHSDSTANRQGAEAEPMARKLKAKKTMDKDILVPESNWSQEQQRALETALTKYKKNSTEDRWQKIANCVPQKSRQECLLRFKYLCDMVKTQRNVEGAINQIGDNSEAILMQDKTDGEKINTIAEGIAIPNDSPLLVVSKKCSKRKNRRKRKDMSSGEESDDAYIYEAS